MKSTYEKKASTIRQARSPIDTTRLTQGDSLSVPIDTHRVRDSACIVIEAELLSSHGKRTGSQRVDTRGEILKPAQRVTPLPD